MSSYLNVYIGPFFIVPKQSVDLTTNGRCCSNPACGKRPAGGNEAFCSRCGHPITAFTKVEAAKKSPYPRDLGEKWADYMVGTATADGRLVWLPNKQDFGDQFNQESPLYLMTISASFVAESAEAFRTAHRDIFDAFHAKYGNELIEAFGAVPYYS
jgi:hypothetical protein